MGQQVTVLNQLNIKTAIMNHMPCLSPRQAQFFSKTERNWFVTGRGKMEAPSFSLFKEKTLL